MILLSELQETKEDYAKLKNLIRELLFNKLKLALSVNKTKIIHAENKSAKFFGYHIHKIKLIKITIKMNIKIKMSCKVPRLVLDVSKSV